jgi:hypothetical protein
MIKPDAQWAYKKALSLFNSRIVESKLVKAKGVVHDPIPIEHSNGKLAAWFIPITIGEKIVGYFQLDTSLEFLRYASFQRDSESIDICPAKTDWLDTKVIREKARKLAVENESLSEPRLTYDVDVSRVVWAVSAIKSDGQSRRIFVVGDTVYNEKKRQVPFTG